MPENVATRQGKQMSAMAHLRRKQTYKAIEIFSVFINL